MPVGGNLGNHLNTGLAKLCVDIDNAGELFDHGLPGVPAGVIGVQLVSGGAAVAATLGYDRDNSTATKMKLWTSSATKTTWIVIPLSGTEVS